MEHKNDLPEGWGKKSGTAPVWNAVPDPEKKKSSETVSGNPFPDKEKIAIPSSFDVKKQTNPSVQKIPEKPYDNSSMILPETNIANRKNPIVYVIPVLGIIVIGVLIFSIQYFKIFDRQSDSALAEVSQNTTEQLTADKNEIQSQTEITIIAETALESETDISSMGSVPETVPVQTILATEAETEPPTEKATEPPTEPRKPPEISCEIKTQEGQYEGFTYTLSVSGSYDYYYIDCKEYGFSDNEGYQVLSGNKSESSLYLTAGSSLDHVTASVTPYYSDGTKGKTVTCSASQPKPKVTSVPIPSTCLYMGTGTPISSDGFLNLRSSKSTSSDSNIITQIPNGATISMYWIDDNSWIYVEYGSYSGYVKESYTKLTNPQGLWADGKGEDEAVTIYSCYKTGEINGRGVSGFTTSYVVNGGAKTTVRETLGDRWHVTANSYCYAYGITWYELYDTDDGDYYGWVDSNFIRFYGG